MELSYCLIVVQYCYKYRTHSTYSFTIVVIFLIHIFSSEFTKLPTDVSFDSSRLEAD